MLVADEARGPGCRPTPPARASTAKSSARWSAARPGCPSTDSRTATPKRVLHRRPRGARPDTAASQRTALRRSRVLPAGGPAARTVPVYRLSRAGTTRSRRSIAERDRLDFVEGWHLDGVAFHAYPAQAAPPNCRPASTGTRRARSAPRSVRWPPTSSCPRGCQTKRACTGGTLIPETNSCQSAVDCSTTRSRIAASPRPAGWARSSWWARAARSRRPASGHGHDQNQCTCPANHA